MSKITMGVKLDEETRDRLKALANARQRSTHWLMKDAINKYLEREEEIERRNREADEAWEEYQRTGQFVSHDAMESWLDTWGTDKEGSGMCERTDKSNESDRVNGKFFSAMY